MLRQTQSTSTPLFITLIFITAFLPGSWAMAQQQEDIVSFLAGIQKQSDSVQSLLSDFTQEKSMALFAEPVKFSGSLAIVRPDRLRWEFVSPVPSVLIFNGDRGIRCNDQAQPENFQISIDPVMKEVANQLWLWLGGDYNRLNALYKLEKSGPFELTVLPKDNGVSEFISAVTLHFNATSLQPEQVVITEAGGDVTRIRFHNSLTNADLSMRLFTDCSADE